MQEGGVPVRIPNSDDVGYRSAYVDKRLEGDSARHLFQISAQILGHKRPGWFVFPKPGYYLRPEQAGRGRPGDSYRHGGLSTHEVLVPLVCLRHRRAKSKITLTAPPRTTAVLGKTSEIVVTVKEFPRYVIEYLINQFCPGVDFDKEINQVRLKLAKNYASPADAPRLLHELKQRRKLDLIARVEVRLETKEDKYWAAVNALNERTIHIDEALINKYPRLMGGLWGIAELTYDEAQVWKQKITPLVLTDFTPFQHGKIDIQDFLQKRSQFSRDEWLDLLVNTAGLNPDAHTLRQKLLIILRLVPMAERMVHLIELGPRETGKSYGYKNLSYYSYMLSGGRATPAALFVHAGNGKPGLVAQFDTLVFDEIANTEFRDPTATVSIFKDYLEYGNFSVGRYQVKGEASVVFIGNLDVMGALPHEKYDHLLEPLPEELVDTALFERIHGFIPGWEMPTPISMGRKLQVIAPHPGEVAHRERAAG